VSPSLPQATSSSSTSTTLVRSLSGLSNETPTLLATTPPASHGRVSNHSTSLTGGTDLSLSLATQSPVLRAWQARTHASLLSSSSTATTDSRFARDDISTRSSLTNTTPTSPQLVSTSTPSLSNQSNTNHQAHATCPALTTPHCSSLSPTTLLAPATQQQSMSMLPTTTFSALCLVWAVLLTQTKRETTQWLSTSYYILVICN